MAETWIKTTTIPCDGIEWLRTKEFLLHRTTWDSCLVKAEV
jgi:hypothetical protein